MFGLYSKRDVEKLTARLRAEYAAVLKEQQEAAETLKAENRALAARVSELEGDRAAVGEALIAAEKAAGEAQGAHAAAHANGEKELALLIQKCRLLSERLSAKYPDAEDVQAFADFTATLHADGEENSLDMEEVLAPKKPLDLGKLCRDLGLMEEE